MGFPNSPSLTISMPASTCRRTTSATALVNLDSSFSAGACSRYISMRSEGRDRLPTWLVNMRFVLRFMSAWLLRADCIVSHCPLYNSIYGPPERLDCTGSGHDAARPNNAGAYVRRDRPYRL